MLAEAAWAAAKTPGPLRAFFLRVRGRRGRQIAAVATARKQSKIGLGIFCTSMLSDTPKKFGLGYAPPADYETMTDLVMEYVAEKGDTRPKVADTVTNDCIGDVRMSDAEWSKAAASLAEYAGYLR